MRFFICLLVVACFMVPGLSFAQEPSFDSVAESIQAVINETTRLQIGGGEARRLASIQEALVASGRDVLKLKELNEEASKQHEEALAQCVEPTTEAEEE